MTSGEAIDRLSFCAHTDYDNMGIVLGLLSAFGFGTADLIARDSTRRIGTMRTLYYMQFVGAVGISIYLIASGELAATATRVEPGLWLVAAFAALLNIASSTMLYRSFQVGIISIVSPVGASYAAITVVLALFSGEQLTPQRAVGVLVVLVGVVLASISRSEGTENVPRRWTTSPGLGMAIGAAVGFGVVFWLIGFHVTPVFGGVIPVWVSRCVTILTLSLLSLVTPLNLALPRGRVWLPVLGVGVLDTVGYVAATLGLQTEQVSIVTVLSSLFSAVTVLLAWLLLRESLQRAQWVGILLIFAGIVLVSV